LVLMTLSLLDGASEISNCLPHHHLLSKSPCLQKLFKVFLVNNLTIWSSCDTLVVLDVRDQQVNVSSWSCFIFFSHWVNSRDTVIGLGFLLSYLLQVLVVRHVNWLLRLRATVDQGLPYISISVLLSIVILRNFLFLKLLFRVVRSNILLHLIGIFVLLVFLVRNILD
jgi:hypothetical protein